MFPKRPTSHNVSRRLSPDRPTDRRTGRACAHRATEELPCRLPFRRSVGRTAARGSVSAADRSLRSLVGVVQPADRPTDRSPAWLHGCTDCNCRFVRFSVAVRKSRRRLTARDLVRLLETLLLSFVALRCVVPLISPSALLSLLSQRPLPLDPSPSLPRRELSNSVGTNQRSGELSLDIQVAIQTAAEAETVTV